MHTLTLTHLHDKHESSRPDIDGLDTHSKRSWCAYEFLVSDYIGCSLVLPETVPSCDSSLVHYTEVDVLHAFEGVDRLAIASLAHS